MAQNSQVVAFASAARTVTANSSAQTNPSGRGVHLVLDVTASSGVAPTLDVKLQRHAIGGDDWVDLPGGAFAQKTTTGTDDLIVYPGVAETANRSVSDHIGYTWRAVATIAGTTPSFTFTLAGAHLA